VVCVESTARYDELVKVCRTQTKRISDVRGWNEIVGKVPVTHYRTVSTSRRVVTFQTTVSNIHRKHFSLVDIDVPSALEVFITLRYINLHLLTYLLTEVPDREDSDKSLCLGRDY